MQKMQDWKIGEPDDFNRMISTGLFDRKMSKRFHALDKAINSLADPK